MSLPWFSFNIKAYVTDTMRLSTEGHGAYLLLLLDYYSKMQAPPDDDAVLASIVRLPVKVWRAHRKVIEPMFRIVDGFWLHDRVEHEIWDAGRRHDLAKTKGKQGADKRWSKTPPKDSQTIAPAIAAAIAGALPGHCPEDAQEQVQVQNITPAPLASPGKRGNSMISEEAYAITGEVLKAMGRAKDDPLSYGAPMQVQAWLNGHWPREAILAGVEKGMRSRGGRPPETIRYFEKAIAQAHAEFTRPLPVVVIQPSQTTVEHQYGSNRKTGGSLNAAIDADIARTIEEINRASVHEAAVQQLSD